MMVSFDIYAVLNVIELIVALVCGVFIFVKRKETYNKVIQLICVCILFLISVFQLPMEIQMETSYALTIVLIIIWFVSIAFIAFELGKNKK